MEGAFPPSVCHLKSNHSGPVFFKKSSFANPACNTVSLLETSRTLYHISIRLETDLNNVCRSRLLQSDRGLGGRTMSSHLGYGSQWRDHSWRDLWRATELFPCKKAQRRKTQQTREELSVNYFDWKSKAIRNSGEKNKQVVGQKIFKTSICPLYWGNLNPFESLKIQN